MSSFLEDVSNLLKLGIGDLGRLEYIKQTLENNKMMYVSDREYLQKLVRQHLSNENTSEVQTMKEKPPETNEEKSSIEDVEHSQFCGKCGKKIESKNNFCPICGTSLNNPTQMHNNTPNPNPPNNDYNNNYHQNSNPIIGLKDPTLTLILSILLGCGVGHLYVGNIKKGIRIMIGTILLVVIGGVLIATGIFAILGAPLIIAAFVLFIWQITDAIKLCRQCNEHLKRTGTPPW